MGLLDYFRSGEPDEPSVRLYCPEMVSLERKEEKYVIATEETEPVDRDGDVAIYECEHCGESHSFLWGPPTPILVES